MRKAALLGLLVLPALGGCDVVVVTAILLSQRDDSSDDPGPSLPIVTVTATDAAAAEAALDTGTFEIVRTGDTSAALDVFFTFASGSGSATPGSDYVTITSPVTIPAGSDRVVLTVTPIDDPEVEGLENVNLILVSSPGYGVGSPGDALVTITSDDLPPDVTVVASDGTASEVGPDAGEFTFTRSVVSASSLEVFFTVSPAGTATPGVDYAALPASVTIPGGSSSVTVPVLPINDLLLESPESVIVNVSPNSQYIVGSPSTATVMIQSEDDPNYHVWVANLTAGQATTEKGNLTTNFGNPNTAVWTEVGTGAATAVFTPPAGMNAILVQMYDTVTYHLDAVEIIDGSGTVIEVVTAPTYSDKMTDTDNLQDMVGPPDGTTVDSAATPTARAFAFSRYSSTVTQFRVNIWGAQRAAGDLAWVQTLVRGGDQTAGGAAVNGAETVYASFRDDSSRNVWVLTYNASGGAPTVTLVESTTNNTVGSHSVAIDQTNGFVYVAATGSTNLVSIGDIRVRRYDFSMGNMALIREINGSLTSAARVEANGIAMDGSNIVLAGGAVQGLEGINHWIWKFTSAGADVAGFPVSVTGDSTDTWWHGVTVDPSNSNIFSAGDHREGAFTQPDLFLHRTLSTGVNDWSQLVGASGAPDLGTTVGLDGSGNVYVAGFQDAGFQGKDAVISKYTNGGTLVGGFPVTHTGAGSADDEILDIAVESDGTFYAVGYETVGGKGQDWWIRKYSSAGTPIWTRTHHHVYSLSGDDRAASVMVSGIHIVVVGQVTLAGGETEIHVRKYVK